MFLEQKNESVPKVLALEYKKKSEPQDDAPPPPPPPPEPVKESVVPTQTVPSVTTDLLVSYHYIGKMHEFYKYTTLSVEFDSARC